ncbi:MAG TPA: biotin--[acetyl-CoA-carboxylase] ligase [Rhodanobacteraceae bacterium]|nr:biotin--[acetyl-CoA-carboxylase] ligase [Rhodanobacteraceae bacterium]
MSGREMLALLADGQAHSGVDMAAALGVSRAAVWKQIEALRGRGLPIIAVAGQGYALPWPLELLDAATIRAQLSVAASSRVGGLDVLWDVDSTSTELRRRPPGEDCQFLLSEGQRAGRGRRGRGWLSPPGLNIYLSCRKHFDGGVASLAGLSLAVGVMVIAALEQCGVAGVGLKWPNDVLADDAKLAGILVELEGEYAGPCDAVIGIGINLRLPTTLREAAGQAVTDLASLCGGVPPARNRLAGVLIDGLVQGLDRFALAGFGAFATDYARHDCLLGRQLRAETPRGVVQGVGAGVDPRGALLLSTAQGVACLDSADVSVRPT